MGRAASGAPAVSASAVSQSFPPGPSRIRLVAHANVARQLLDVEEGQKRASRDGRVPAVAQTEELEPIAPPEPDLAYPEGRVRLQFVDAAARDHDLDGEVRVFSVDVAKGS
jgi:hypothetical protein